MSPAGRLEAFCLKLPAEYGQGEKVGLYNYTGMHMMYTCARVYTKHVYVCLWLHIQHFLIVIYWQLGWFIDWHEKEPEGRMECFSGSSLCKRAAGS